ncbi:MAG: cation:proton antiporter [Bacteroidales bacterium]|nr:cation:proton antiporter [Bacteroidales bacterium]
MSALPPLFLDLAIILITAGVITVVFKWLKQPLVLGYIVAGFFIGPYFPWFPAVSDVTNVHVWSDIGIVFLMFALGLEFSIKKLKKVGSTGAITALTELAIMFLIGSSVGRILGWSSMECIFLGCMLSISSTSIIIKSFEDLKLKQQKFTSSVTAVLVVEDIIAVLLLVLLSTISVSKSFDGGQLAMSLVKLVFFLIVWFVFGIFLIPTFLRWMRRYMTEETLCIVAVGLCFGMVVLASYAGFSTALGAFVMGAILAETIEADVIHRIITPIKNLFCAVFFVSVGMLVDPHILVKYLVPILVIAGTVILFKSTAATLGFVLSGKNLKTAVQSGFCFCQIGEFSFIIAGLGLSFGVINPDIYPIIVSVSIVTTFVTPYMIKASNPFYSKLEPRLPQRLKEALERYSNSAKQTNQSSSVRSFLKKQFSSILIYSAINAAICLLSFTLLKPFLNTVITNEAGEPSFWGNFLGMMITLTIMIPFVWAIAVRNVNRLKIKELLDSTEYSQAIVIPVLLLRYFLALFFIGLVIGSYIHLAVGFLIILAVFIVLVVLFSKRAIGFYQRIENQFVSNFNSRQAQQSFKIPTLLENNFYLERVAVTQYSPYSGKRLMDTNFREDYGINIVSIERAGQVYDLPPKEMLILPGDRLSVMGSEDQIAHLRSVIDVEPDMLIHDHSDNELNIYRLTLTNEHPFVGMTISESHFSQHFHAMIIAIERDGQQILNPRSKTVFRLSDIVWFVSPDELDIHKFTRDCP